jgi:putative ABC transport system permease protein
MLKIALSNITRRRNNSIMAVICIALAVGIFTLIWSVFSLSSSGLELSQSRLGADVLIYPSHAQVDEEKLLFSGLAEMVYMDEEAFSAAIAGDLAPKIEETSAQFFLQTLPNAGCCEVTEAFRIVGVEIESDFILKAWLEQEGIESLNDQEIIVGRNVGKKAGDTTLILNSLFTVKGVLHKTGTGMDKTIFMNMDMARRLADQTFPLTYLGVDSVDSAVTCYLLKLKDGTDATTFVEELQNKSTDINVASVRETQSQLRTQIALFSKILFLFWIAILILCTIALVSLFRGLIYGRKKEIGYLRAIGMQRKEIYLMFLWEIGLLGAMGGILGGVAGVLLVNPLLSQIQSLLTIPTGEWTVSMGLMRVFSGIGLSLLLCALIAVVPVSNLSKLAPYEVISEGEI